MSIITISRGSFSNGCWIAGAVAQRLGYQCFSRDAILEASKEFNVPEVRLVRALHDAPSFLDRITHGKEKYIAQIRKAFLERVQQDDVVYHGLAGHFFLTGVSHVLKVRIIADIEDRISWEMEREEISEDEARRIIRKDDDERRRWSQSLYGIDTADIRLYDLLIHIRRISVEDAVDMICDFAKLPAFQATPESRKVLEDLSAQAEAACAPFVTQ